MFSSDRLQRRWNVFFKALALFAYVQKIISSDALVHLFWTRASTNLHASWGIGSPICILLGNLVPIGVEFCKVLISCYHMAVLLAVTIRCIEHRGTAAVSWACNSTRPAGAKLQSSWELLIRGRGELDPG